MRRLLVALFLAECGAPSKPAVPAQPAPVVMQGPTPTAYADKLVALGLDPKNLPPLGKLAPEQLRKVMPLFAKSLGTKCEGCHASSFDVRTPEMNVAEQMWNHFSRELTLVDGSAAGGTSQTKTPGSPLFCDSCHHGAMKVLDRTKGPDALFVWMDENYVAKLARKDGAEHACPTCHGEPAEMKFIRFWAAGKPFPTADPHLSR